MTRDRSALLLKAAGEAAEFRQVAEAIVEWERNNRRPGAGCVVCGCGPWHEEGCPVPLARAALAATPKPTSGGRTA